MQSLLVKDLSDEYISNLYYNIIIIYISNIYMYNFVVYNFTTAHHSVYYKQDSLLVDWPQLLLIWFVCDCSPFIVIFQELGGDGVRTYSEGLLPV